MKLYVNSRKIKVGTEFKKKINKLSRLLRILIIKTRMFKFIYYIQSSD